MGGDEMREENEGTAHLLTSTTALAPPEMGAAYTCSTMPFQASPLLIQAFSRWHNM